MNNKFINNNGVNLHNTSKKPVKKTKIESQFGDLLSVITDNQAPEITK